MLRFAFQDVYDVAILISGDGDFASAVNAVKDLGKQVETVQFRSGSSYQLRNVCDVIIYLSEEFLRDCFKA